MPNQSSFRYHYTLLSSHTFEIVRRRLFYRQLDLREDRTGCRGTIDEHSQGINQRAKFDDTIEYFYKCLSGLETKAAQWKQRKRISGGHDYIESRVIENCRIDRKLHTHVR